MDNRQFSLPGDAELSSVLSASAKIYRHDVQRHRFVRFTAGAQQEHYEDEVHSGSLASLEWNPATAFPVTVDAGAEFHRQDADNQHYAAVAFGRCR
jgi:hypothetical protein